MRSNGRLHTAPLTAQLPSIKDDLQPLFSTRQSSPRLYPSTAPCAQAEWQARHRLASRQSARVVGWVEALSPGPEDAFGEMQPTHAGLPGPAAPCNIEGGKGKRATNMRIESSAPTYPRDFGTHCSSRDRSAVRLNACCVAFRTHRNFFVCKSAARSCSGVSRPRGTNASCGSSTDPLPNTKGAACAGNSAVPARVPGISGARTVEEARTVDEARTPAHGGNL
jgi:hypothetical protein